MPETFGSKGKHPFKRLKTSQPILAELGQHLEWPKPGQIWAIAAVTGRIRLPPGYICRCLRICRALVPERYLAHVPQVLCIVRATARPISAHSCERRITASLCRTLVGKRRVCDSITAASKQCAAERHTDIHYDHMWHTPSIPCTHRDRPSPWAAEARNLR